MNDLLLGSFSERRPRVVEVLRHHGRDLLKGG